MKLPKIAFTATKEPKLQALATLKVWWQDDETTSVTQFLFKSPIFREDINYKANVYKDEKNDGGEAVKEMEWQNQWPALMETITATTRARLRKSDPMNDFSSGD